MPLLMGDNSPPSVVVSVVDSNIVVNEFELHSRYYPFYRTPPLGQDTAQGQFLAEFNRFEFRVLLLLD